MLDDDRQLVNQLLSGNETAFKAFFDDYYDRLFRFALSRAGSDRDVAQEVAQRALCRALRALRSWRGEASLFSWLAQIARNEWADIAAARSRDAQRYSSIDSSDAARAQAEQVAADAPANSDVIGELESAAVIRQVLDSLPGRYGEVLEWKYMEGRSVEDIAQSLGGSFEAAQSVLARARQAFRAAMRLRGIDIADHLT